MTNPRASAVAPRKWVAAAVCACVGIITACRAGERAAESSAHTEKVAGTPHFYQGDPRARFPEDGKNYCCPTAVSDSFVYLAAHGFPRLLPGDIADPAEAQIAVIKKLASPEFMRTDPAIGTDGAEACLGIRRYVEASGYVCRTIEYQGWRPMPKAMASYVTATAPSLDWIKRAAADGHGAAWVNIGWYVRGATADEWVRIGGHWVAVVGYGTDGTAHEDPAILLVDNPAVRSRENDPAKKGPARRRPADGTDPPTREGVAADVMTTTPVTQGRLVGKFKGLPRDAAGMYRVSGEGVRMSKKYDAAFLDGAIVLVIGDPEPGKK